MIGFLRQYCSSVVRVIGFAAAFGVIVAYVFSQYAWFSPLILLVSIICIAASFVEGGFFKTLHAKQYIPDIFSLLVLVGILLPLYVYKIYTVPWQINTDEVTIMLVAKKLIAEPGLDLFGLSYYFGFPSLIFVTFGWLSTLIGGVELFQFRIIHSLFGVGSALLFYLLCRQYFSVFKSVTFSLILGFNHALFAISRMAMRDNTGLFLELLALVLLVYGLKSKSRISSFLGGVATGLGFYTYFPGRIVPIIWVTVLFLLFLLYPLRKSIRVLTLHGGLFIFGFMLVASPVLIATVQQSDQAFFYQKQQFLLYEEGRQLAQTWTNNPTESGAWKQNIRNGLLTFNTARHDQGYIYPNYGYGFLDPYSGVLLWVGFIVVVWRVLGKNRTVLDLLSLTGFSILYFSFAFLITKAPNYTRLLVILPFTSYFIGEALWWFYGVLVRMFVPGVLARFKQFILSALVLCTVALIAATNLRMFMGFVTYAQVHGNDVGSTARYVELRHHIPNQQWVLASDYSYMYYSWGESWQWQSWLGFFAAESQPVVVLSPSEAFTQKYISPTTIFTSIHAWNAYELEFREYNRLYIVRSVTPDGRLLAIEIRGIR